MPDFITVPAPIAYAAEARRQGKLVVWIPRGVRSKEKLFGIFAERLRFPAYFGWNWDAFEECLRDSIAQTPLVIVHEALPFGAGENRALYCDILRAALAAQPATEQRLVVVVPAA